MHLMMVVWNPALEPRRNRDVSSAFAAPADCLPPLGGKVLAWWRHQMEAFSTSLALCEGNPPVTGGFPHKDQWRGALMFSLICSWSNGWANNQDAGDLRRHCAHYDVTVMLAMMRPLKYITLKEFRHPCIFVKLLLFLLRADWAGHIA